MIAEIIVDILNSEVDKIFDYNADENIKIGQRVLVPFGNRTVEGYVINIKETSSCDKSKLKSVIKALDKEVQSEPIIALDGGQDGLKFYRIIIEQAYKYLNTNGILALEIGYEQKEEVIRLLKESGKYTDIYSKKDLSGNDRIVVCKCKNGKL